jgi:hypothetical protein
MNISQFRTRLLNGCARPNQFLVTLTWPGVVGNPGGDHNLLVTSAALPASNVNPTIVQYRGREVKFAGERIFDPWTITVLNDTNMTLRSYFEKWSSAMNEYVNNGGVTTPALYYADLTVQQLDRNDLVIRTYELKNSFPITVSEVGLAYSANDVISEFNVTFQYSHFEVRLP